MPLRNPSELPALYCYADAAEEAPASRPVEGKRPGDGPGGKFGPERFKGKIDPEKLEALKGRFKNLDPEKRKEILVS